MFSFLNVIFETELLYIKDFGLLPFSLQGAFPTSCNCIFPCIVQICKPFHTIRDFGLFFARYIVFYESIMSFLYFNSFLVLSFAPEYNNFS